MIWNQEWLSYGELHKRSMYESRNPLLILQLGMGRGKVEIKKIENTKRRKGLIKKANELAILTDAMMNNIFCVFFFIQGAS